MNAVLKQLPSLIRASLDGDKRTVELSVLSIIRKIKKENPLLSSELAEIITTYNAGAPLTRSMGIEPPPVDKDSFMSLVKISDYSTFDQTVILNEQIDKSIRRFLKERELMTKLIANGIKPPNSILFYGPPGVGKTLLTKYVAHCLSLPLITLDLSSAISSYLGKTGQNLKKILDYGKNSPSILLLDEFDAVAKRRDDPSDLGELKRIVNVLLKELEEWPAHSIIVGATNHPEFLDKAIWRRFDLKIEIPFPNEEQRFQLWKFYLNKEIVEIEDSLIRAVAKVIQQISPSDIKQICDHVLRQVIVEESDPIKSLITRLKETHSGDNSSFNKVMTTALKETYGGKLSQAKIATLLGISPSTVNHHLKKSIKK
ncbi:AAA family ATPase [Paenibacillus larvae]|uniref:AAA ATPase n=3 Tax=root TaxID=1 RepID=V9W7L0_9BACL|nr:AAA family ATPase [Paenibacillus larvae]YP_009838654.1 AAA family ATPase [Paenibacillus phage Yyerffej]UYL93214.1 RecA-like protease [Paenibacillus phage Callan]UYL93290.1 RecA-like protease [Paenibacillus phage Dash]AHD06133.1 AAA ATPase [Paenibacillus larvae subsp. larvae DSM 25430]AQR77420.1 AAA family ATPase [Paenibacillus larvae subsp. larvae]AVF21557.1 AAA ATPase [Paenibacillus larvae subsp. larvae]